MFPVLFPEELEKVTIFVKTRKALLVQVCPEFALINAHEDIQDLLIVCKVNLGIRVSAVEW